MGESARNDNEHLPLLVHRFGPERLLLADDAPFFPDQMARSVASVAWAHRTAVLPPGDHGLLARNAEDWLGRSVTG